MSNYRKTIDMSHTVDDGVRIETRVDQRGAEQIQILVMQPQNGLLITDYTRLVRGSKDKYKNDMRRSYSDVCDKRTCGGALESTRGRRI